MRESIARLQSAVRELPQAELETLHYFAHGLYARVVPRAAGTLIVGKVHKREHFYIVAKGRVAVTNGDDKAVVYEAGDIIVSQPGTKRAVLALEDSICMTVHHTMRKSLKRLEKELVEPDETALYDSGNKLKELT